MTHHNEQIQAFLTYYYKSEVPPQYAVLLKGKWGSGKTWFIEKSIKQLNATGGKALYISLYGISNTRNIEQEFFRQLHPVLGSKGAMLAGKLLKGAIKATFKVDVNGDGYDDGSITANVPDLKLPDYLQNTEGFVLIFDDVERCAIPIPELLGYINSFVEHGGYKAILVANEEEIRVQGDNTKGGNAYLRIKEKLIGKTFEVEPDLQSAVNTFVDEVPLPQAKTVLKENQALVEELYRASEYKNLRHLRQAILDYARFLEILNEPALGHAELLVQLLTMFLIYSFEIKSGAIQPSDISKIRTSLYASVGSPKATNSDTPYNVLSRKYVGTNLTDTVLPEQIWEDIFSTGLLDPQAINEAIAKSKYFVHNNQPDWVRLWDAFSLPDSEFELVLQTVSSRFCNNEYDQVGVFKHVVGTLLMLSDIQLYKKPKAEIVTQAIKNIDALKKNGSLGTVYSVHGDLFENTGFGGLGYSSQSTAEFQEVDAYLRKVGNEAVRERYPDEANELLPLMVRDTATFCRRLSISNQGEKTYRFIPILKHLAYEDFVEAALKLSSDQINLLSGLILQRYRSSYDNKELAQELPWARDVAKGLKQAKATREGKMTGYLLGRLSEHFSTAADQLEASIAIGKSEEDNPASCADDGSCHQPPSAVELPETEA